MLIHSCHAVSFTMDHGLFEIDIDVPYGVEGRCGHSRDLLVMAHLQS